MCQNTTTAVRTEKSVSRAANTPKRAFKLVHSVADSLGFFRLGLGVPVTVREGEKVEDYTVGMLKGHAGIWVVAKIDPNGGVREYTVRVTGDDVSRWSCDHNKVCGFSEFKVATGCRHARLVAALCEVLAAADAVA